MVLRDKTADKIASLVGKLCAFGDNTIRAESLSQEDGFLPPDVFAQKSKQRAGDYKVSRKRFDDLRDELYSLVPEEQFKVRFPETYEHIQTYISFINRPTMLGPM